MQLARELQPIYDLEIRRGNTVDYIVEPAGTACPYAIVFEQPLHKAQIESELTLSETVRTRESHDPHYPVEAGYQGAMTRHTVAGPVAGK